MILTQWWGVKGGQGIKWQPTKLRLSLVGNEKLKTIEDQVNGNRSRLFLSIKAIVASDTQAWTPDVCVCEIINFLLINAV